MQGAQAVKNLRDTKGPGAAARKQPGSSGFSMHCPSLFAMVPHALWEIWSKTISTHAGDRCIYRKSLNSSSISEKSVI